MKIDDKFHFLYGLFSANVGVITSLGEIALIDSGYTEESIDAIFSYLDIISDLNGIKYVFLTHGDPDHIGGVHRLQNEYNAKVVIHEAETKKLENPPPFIHPSRADIMVDHDRTFHVGEVKVRLIVTPGHSLGSICVYNEKHQILFSGDTIVEPSYSLRIPPWEPYRRLLYILPVRAGFETYINSLLKLSNIEVRLLLPGHGKPVSIGGNEKIVKAIDIVKRLKEETYDLLKEDLCPSELAVKLNAHELVVEETVKKLVNEGKVELSGEKCLRKEHSYRRKKFSASPSPHSLKRQK